MGRLDDAAWTRDRVVGIEISDVWAFAPLELENCPVKLV